MRTTTNPIPNSQPPNYQGQAPSVPLSVYRDLAAELQAAQALASTLTAQNQQLIQENQTLRQEIVKAVNSVMELQKLVNPNTQTSYNPGLNIPASAVEQINQPTPEPRSINRAAKPSPPRKPVGYSAPKKIKVNKPKRQEPAPRYFSTPEPVYIEEQEVRYYTSAQVETSEANPWVLLLSTILIIVTAFGAGYLVVRPLLLNHNR
jgi:cobalamin biosynthesis Mg chelatase CobN